MGSRHKPLPGGQGRPGGVGTDGGAQVPRRAPATAFSAHSKDAIVTPWVSRTDGSGGPARYRETVSGACDMGVFGVDTSCARNLQRTPGGGMRAVWLGL